MQQNLDRDLSVPTQRPTICWATTRQMSSVVSDRRHLTGCKSKRRFVDPNRSPVNRQSTTKLIWSRRLRRDYEDRRRKERTIRLIPPSIPSLNCPATRRTISTTGRRCRATARAVYWAPLATKRKRKKKKKKKKKLNSQPAGRTNPFPSLQPNGPSIISRHSNCLRWRRTRRLRRRRRVRHRSTATDMSLPLAGRRLHWPPVAPFRPVRVVTCPSRLPALSHRRASILNPATLRLRVLRWPRRPSADASNPRPRLHLLRSPVDGRRWAELFGPIKWPRKRRRNRRPTENPAAWLLLPKAASCLRTRVRLIRRKRTKKVAAGVFFPFSSASGAVRTRTRIVSKT